MLVLLFSRFRDILVTSYCGGLKEKASKGSGTVRMCDLVGGSVLLWRHALRSYKLSLARVTQFFLLPADQNVGLSPLSTAPCLPACRHFPPC